MPDRRQFSLPALAEAVARHARPYLPTLLPGAALLLIAIAGPGLAGALRYDRVALAGGEWWRLFTGHLVHLGPAHLLLNLAGLVLVGWLFARELGVRMWFALLVLCALGTSFGLYFLSTDVAWYAGLSGVLHGLFTAGALARLGREWQAGALLLAALAAKLLTETAFGASSEALVGGRVITAAHWYGALSGLTFLLLLRQSRALLAR